MTRSLQLTVKKTARSVKTIDSTLLMIKDGERTTISSRVAELDQMMPQYLGVSQAVLDSVIFCHQDESLWPMSEPATLKKKFDEIFEALKYTKAIANIKDLAKGQKIQLIKHQGLENQYKIDKDRGERAEKKSKALQEEIETLRAQSEQLNQDISVTQEAADKKRQQALSFQNIRGELTLKRNSAEEKQSNIDELRMNLVEMTESDEYLESTLSQYEERMDQYEQEKEQAVRQYREATGELEKSRKVLDGKLAEKGRYDAEKNKYERDLIARVALVQQSASSHGIRGFEGDLEDNQIQAFVDRMAKLSRDKGKEMESIQKTMGDELGEKRAIQDDIRDRKASRTQDKVSARQNIAAADRKMHSIQDEIENITIDEGSKSVLESTLRDLQERRQRAEDDFEGANWDALIQTENSQLRQFEEEAEQLGNEMVRTTQLAEERAQMTYTKKQLKERQQSMEALTATYNDKIVSVIGTSWESSSLEERYRSALEEKSQAVSEAQNQRDNMSRTLEQATFRLSSFRDSRKKKSETMKQCQQTVLDSIITDGASLASVDLYLEELSQIELDIMTVKSDISNTVHTKDFFSSCLKVAESQDKCHLCERKFTQRQEKSHAILALQKRIARQANDEIMAELSRLEGELKEANAARPQYEVYTRLCEIELPELDKNIEQAEEQRSGILSQLEGLDSKVKQLEDVKREVEAIGKPVGSLTQHQKDIEELESKLSNLSSQQKSSGDSTRSMDEIKSQQTSCLEQTRAAKTKVNTLTRDKERARTAIHQLQMELQASETKIGTANQLLKDRQSLSRQLTDLKESVVNYRETVEHADQELNELEPKLARIKTEISDLEARTQGKLKEVRDQQAKINNTINKLENANAEISSYLEAGGPGRLVSCERAIKACERELSRIESEISQLTQKANKADKQMSDSEKVKASIVNNIRYRKNLKDFSVLQAQIEELETRYASEDHRRLQIEVEKLDFKVQKLKADRGPILGSMRAKDDELGRLLQEWEADYKDAARNYREAHVKVETTKAAIDDLIRYGKALDQAIMKYHSLKMEEINRIAGELWHATYQGTDIDTILINSDSENATGRSSYNYRVSMVKQDAEMDMRGRCSAGQRVLASIIIRLALAECFGVNCGVSRSPVRNLSQSSNESANCAR